MSLEVIAIIISSISLLGTIGIFIWVKVSRNIIFKELDDALNPIANLKVGDKK